MGGHFHVAGDFVDHKRVWWASGGGEPGLVRSFILGDRVPRKASFADVN